MFYSVRLGHSLRLFDDYFLVEQRSTALIAETIQNVRHLIVKDRIDVLMIEIDTTIMLNASNNVAIRTSRYR